MHKNYRNPKVSETPKGRLTKLFPEEKRSRLCFVIPLLWLTQILQPTNGQFQHHSDSPELREIQNWSASYFFTGAKLVRRLHLVKPSYLRFAQTFAPD